MLADHTQFYSTQECFLYDSVLSSFILKFLRLESRHEEQIRQMHRSTFEPIDGQHYDPNKAIEEIESSTILVAENAGRVLGYGSCCRLSDAPDVAPGSSALHNWNKCLSWAKSLDEERVLQFLHSRSDAVGGPVVYRRYDNAVLRQTSQIMPQDYEFRNSAVLPDHRGQGIGKELVRQRIEIAIQDGATAIFASCWMGGSSWRVLQKNGFQPMRLWGPSYYDGHAAKAMCRRLQQQPQID